MAVCSTTSSSQTFRLNLYQFLAKKPARVNTRVAKKTTMYMRRAALIPELRMNISSALVAGGVSERTLEYFRRRAQDKDPVIARLAQACLQTAETFNTTYY